MLFRLLIFRLLPVFSLGIYKERKNTKLAVYFLFLCYSLCLVIAGLYLFYQEHWKGIIYLLLSMFPHYIFYGFVCWMLLRCVSSSWSVRVWRRIYSLSIIGVLLGILTELYWNPQILDFFVKKF